jgi:hypothetical protein
MSQTRLSTELVAPALPATTGRCRTRNQRGMTTAEYAVGTIAAASFAGILIKILTDPTIQATLLELLLTILRYFMQVPAA